MASTAAQSVLVLVPRGTLGMTWAASDATYACPLREMTCIKKKERKKPSFHVTVARQGFTSFNLDVSASECDGFWIDEPGEKEWCTTLKVVETQAEMESGAPGADSLSRYCHFITILLIG